MPVAQITIMLAIAAIIEPAVNFSMRVIMPPSPPSMPAPMIKLKLTIITTIITTHIIATTMIFSNDIISSFQFGFSNFGGVVLLDGSTMILFTNLTNTKMLIIGIRHKTNKIKVSFLVLSKPFVYSKAFLNSVVNICFKPFSPFPVDGVSFGFAFKFFPK